MQHMCGCFKYVPYYLDPDGQCYANDETDPHTLQRTPLEKTLKRVLQAMHMSVRSVTPVSEQVSECERIILCWDDVIVFCAVDCRENYKDIFFKNLQKARETKSGDELKEVCESESNYKYCNACHF